MVQEPGNSTQARLGEASNSFKVYILIVPFNSRIPAYHGFMLLFYFYLVQIILEFLLIFSLDSKSYLGRHL